MVHGSLRDDYNEFFIAVSLAPASVPAQKEEEEEEKQVTHRLPTILLSVLLGLSNFTQVSDPTRVFTNLHTAKSR